MAKVAMSGNFAAIVERPAGEVLTVGQVVMQHEGKFIKHDGSKAQAYIANLSFPCELGDTIEVERTVSSVIASTGLLYSVLANGQLTVGTPVQLAANGTIEALTTGDLFGTVERVSTDYIVIQKA